MNAVNWFYGQPHGFNDCTAATPPQPFTPSEDAINERTLLNAREGWDSGDTISSNWLSDVDDSVLRDIAMRAIAANCAMDNEDDRDKAISALCERFVRECAQWYRAKAVEELTEGYDQ